MSAGHHERAWIAGGAPAAKFGDFAKAANDFFARDLPSDRLRVEATARAAPTARGAAVRVPGAFSDELKVSVQRALSADALALELKSTTTFAALRERVLAKSVTTMAAPSNVLTQQIVLSAPATAGLRLDVSGTLAPAGPSGARAGAEYVAGPLAATLAVDLAPAEADAKDDAGRRAMRAKTVAASAAVRVADFQLGGEASWAPGSRVLEAYKLGVSLDRAREKAAVFAHTGLRTFSAAYAQRFADHLELAARATYALGAKDGDKGKTSVEVGAKWWLSAPPALGKCCAAGGSFVKATVDSAGALALALASELRPGVQLVLGAAVDATKPGAGHKLGVDLLYTA